MTWERIWATIKKLGWATYSPEEMAWAESRYDPSSLTAADLRQLVQELNQVLPTAEGITRTDPNTGRRTVISGGVLYESWPKIKDDGTFATDPKTGEVAYGNFKEVSTATEQWQVEDWIKDAQGNTVGYYDKSGVPQALDKLLQPQAESDVWTGRTQSIGGRDFPIYRRPDGTEYVGDNPYGLTQDAKQEPGPMPTATSDQPYILANGQWQRNPDYVSPAEQEASRVALDRADRDRFMAAQQSAAELKQRQQELLWNRAEQAQRNIFQPQPTYVNAESTEPVNWINYWKAGQDVAKKQVAQEQQQGAINQFAANLPPQRLEQTYASTAQLQPGYREGIDPATGQMIAWNRPEQMTAMWDPLTQTYRPETDQEWRYRLAASGVAAGVLTPEMAQQSSLSSFYDQAGGNPLDKQAWMESQAALWRQPNFPTGPETPQWARGVLQNPQANINLGTLGQQGNMVRPVSAQMYSGWAPSQQQGYQGLAAAQKGTYWPDYQANIEKMWGASRPGQLARQRVPSWSY